MSSARSVATCKGLSRRWSARTRPAASLARATRRARRGGRNRVGLVSIGVERVVGLLGRDGVPPAPGRFRLCAFRQVLTARYAFLERDCTQSA